MNGVFLMVLYPHWQGVVGSYGAMSSLNMVLEEISGTLVNSKGSG